MKKLLLFIGLFAIAACSSAPKEEEAAAPAPTVKETPAPAPADSTSNSMTADSGSSEGGDMSSGFPDVEGTERSGATCKNGSEERLVSVIDTREGPCGVVYTKDGNKATVAYAKNVMGFCDQVFDNIVGNLTGGGWDCGGAGNTASAPAEESKPAEQPAEEKPAAEGGE